MKKWITAAAAVLLLAVLVWAPTLQKDVSPGEIPGDDSIDQPGVSGDLDGNKDNTEGDVSGGGNKESNGDGVYPGDMACDFELADLEGNMVKLSDYRGRVVLINFWQTTCSWCREELPLLDELYKAYKDGDVVALAVNIAEDKEKVRQMVEDNGFTFPVLLDTEAEAAKKYLVSSIPTNYIITPGGEISNMHIGLVTYQQMEQYVEAAFRE